MKDSAAQARSELEGSCLHPSLVLSFYFAMWITRSSTEFRARSLAQFADLQERLKASNSAVEVLERAADPVLEIAFPGACQRGDPPSRVELLRAAPERLRAIAKEAALLSSDRALTLVKSHYTRVDLQRVGEGFAADADDEKIESLMKEA